MANATASSSTPTLPNDAKLIALMLAARGIQDADERVLHQLLDFAHRYTSDILQDAQSFADHANRPGRVETEDVELAVQARSGWEFTEAAPKDYLLPIARELNKIPLPTLNAAYSHIALPEPHLMLGHPNFTLVPRYPAPESLGLFRTGEEGSEDESDEDGDGESEEMDDDDEDEEEGSSQRAGEEQAKTTSQERNDDGEASVGDRMETDTTNQHTADASTPIATTNQAETQAESVRVNGVKRHLEEDDDYDA
ncbi:hypothetical protein QFC24_003094 [Naganishia onofrii]|uniref:Uncharacterized protein n=1 Tax=Naganishia onofrii TaxID=1851511 RepID=A0ACC2XMY5_9TREE|nr:hypothetical protein QFC24_003094 [Naganishia onofrii]